MRLNGSPPPWPAGAYASRGPIGGGLSDLSRASPHRGGGRGGTGTTRPAIDHNEAGAVHFEPSRRRHPVRPRSTGAVRFGDRFDRSGYSVLLLHDGAAGADAPAAG